MNTRFGIVVFSAVETVTVAVWGLILDVGDGLSAGAQIGALIVLFVGYLVEHVIAFNVAKGRPFFSKPRP